MTKIVTNGLQLDSALAFKDAIANTAGRYYVFAAEHLPFDDEDNPPTPDRSNKGLQYDIYDKMMFGKAITEADVALLVEKNTWVANTAYQRFDDEVEAIWNEDFFVVADESSSYHVFKCLNNNEGLSVSKPLLSETSSEDPFYLQVSDSYQWKYLYSISGSQYTKFATDNYMPVYLNANTSAAAVPGALEVIIVDMGGSDYNSYTTGFFADFAIGGNTRIYALDPTLSSSNTGFYNTSAIYLKSGTGAGQVRVIESYIVSGTQRRIVLDSAFTVAPDGTTEYDITPAVVIEGNGQGAKARSVINTAANSIHRVEMIERGNNYTWATAVITGNTGIINVTSNTSIAANNAIVRPVVSPQGGHGANNYTELYAKDIGVSVTFANTETGVLPTLNDFRTVGIVKNPLLASVTVDISTGNGTFSDGMLVTQTDTGATGEVSDVTISSVTLTNVKGVLEVGKRIYETANTSISANVDAIDGQSLIFDNSTTLNVTITDTGLFANGFALDERVTQDDAYGYVYSANTTVVKLTGVRGTFVASDIDNDYFITGDDTGAVGRITAIRQPDLVPYSGEVIYIQNMPPIQRANTQSETVKLIVSF
jgi:hypothetical protein